MLIDTHAHLDVPAFEADREEVLARAIAAGVTTILNVSIEPSTWKRSIAFADAHASQNVYGTVGCHPHDATQLTSERLAEMAEYLSRPRIVAVGEVGLDYFRNLSPKDVQKKALSAQLALAREFNKPAIIHDRDSHEDILQLIKKDGVGTRGVFHCFSGDYKFGEEVIAAGYYVSFAGPLTFKNSLALQEAAARLPLDRMLVETDCPYLTPVPYRGKRNEPAHVRLTITRLAELRGQPLEEVALAIRNNARELFGV